MTEQKTDITKDPEYLKIQAEWNRDSKLQEEFAGDFETYFYFKKPIEGLRVKSTSFRG